MPPRQSEVKPVMNISASSLGLDPAGYNQHAALLANPGIM